MKVTVARTPLIVPPLLKPNTSRTQFPTILRRYSVSFIPSWSKDPKNGAKMINACAETLATKPAFRSIFKKRRCLIPADGFYEWKRESKKKPPFHIHMRDNKPFAFAGLWDSWRGPDGVKVESCTIITTDSNALVQPLHNRMPVILDPALPYAREDRVNPF